MNIHDFQVMKQQGRKISMITCYDYTSAKIVSQSNVDCILVGDTLGMVMHGNDTTLPTTIDMMALHTQAVARGAKNKFIVGDMPFLSYRKDLTSTMNAVEKLMQAGANCIKLEGCEGNEVTVRHIVDSGVPVMGHLGLTPQSIHQLGGFKVQGKVQAAADNLIRQAKAMQAAGCFALVLECVPASLAKQITELLEIPTIGIGAGKDVSGQVLVFQDMLGMDNQFTPKFLKTYMNGFELMLQAFNQYDREVKQGEFPEAKHSYLLPQEKETA